MNRATISFITACCLSLPVLTLRISGQSAMDKAATVPPDVRVKVTATNRTATALELEVATTNSGAAPAYIMTSPQRSDRSRGFYIEESRSDPSLIFCTAQLYPPATFNMYFNGTHVHLLLLKPGESHLEKISVPLPVRTTEPPFEASPGTRQLTGPVKHVEAVVGVLPQTEELDRLLARKVGHDSITGLETVGGRSLYESQQVVRSAPIEIEITELMTTQPAPPAGGTLLHEAGHVDPPKPQ
jgi:hypothetical protein